MADLDPAAIKAAHKRHVPGCQTRAFRSQQHKRCEPYRLADALEAEQAKVEGAWDAGWASAYSGRVNAEQAVTGNPYRRDAANPEQTPHATNIGYCVCYDRPAPDCGIAAHRAQAKPPHATAATVRSEPQSRPRVNGRVVPWAHPWLPQKPFWSDPTELGAATVVRPSACAVCGRTPQEHDEIGPMA